MTAKNYICNLFFRIAIKYDRQKPTIFNFNKRFVVKLKYALIRYENEGSRSDKNVWREWCFAKISSAQQGQKISQEFFFFFLSFSKIRSTHSKEHFIRLYTNIHLKLIKAIFAFLELLTIRIFSFFLVN